MTTETTENFFGKAEAVSKGDLTPTENVLCPLCNIPPKPFAVDYQGFTLCQCEKCGLQFVSPRLSFDELADKVYSDNYFPKGEQKVSPATIHYFQRQLVEFDRLLGGPKRVLDIGCGNGGFVEFAAEHGWEIAGVDIKLSPDARQLVCPIWEGRLQDLNFDGNKFDLVRMNHVLEHTQNPLEELEICRELLNPSGILFISVPNISGISPKLKNFQSRCKLKAHRWRHYAAMHHLFFFSPKTLLRLVEKAGFEVLQWNTPVPKKDGQNEVVEKMYRTVMEGTNSSSILDVYCTPKN